MTPTLLVDLVIVVLLVLAAWSGGRTGAARSAVSLLALILGLFISAQGQAVIAQFVALLLPGVDIRLISAGIFVGGVWVLLAIASYVIGRLLQASLRAIHLGAVDTAFGAVFGVVQWGVAIAAVIFVFDATAAAGIGLPTPINALASAITAAQSSDVIRGLIYPIAYQLIGGILPEGLRALLAP